MRWQRLDNKARFGKSEFINYLNHTVAVAGVHQGPRNLLQFRKTVSGRQVYRELIFLRRKSMSQHLLFDLGRIKL